MLRVGIETDVPCNLGVLGKSPALLPFCKIMTFFRPLPMHFLA